MQRPEKIVLIRSRWILGSAVACVVALVALAFYFRFLNPVTAPREANQITGSNEREAGSGSTGDTVREAVSRKAVASPRENEPSGELGKTFYDFSGITTVDPDSPSTTPAPKVTPEPEEETKAALPLVFLTIDPKLLKLTPEQQAVIDQLKQSFLDIMGSAPQDPKDPKYLERWEEAQPQIDQRLKAELGQEFFVRYEMAVTTRTKP